MKNNTRNLLRLFMFLICFASGSSKFGVGVGVVLDVDSLEGKLCLSYLSMAHDDFCAAHGSYNTRLVLHVRDSNGQVINAAASEIDLLNKEKVNAVVAIVKAFQWHQVVLVFEDTDSGEREVGIWTTPLGITIDLKMVNINNSYSISKDNLHIIIWPGESVVLRNGWEIPVTGKKLRVGVQMKEGFTEFVKVEKESLTNSFKVTWVCINVFDSVMKLLPYPVLYEYVPYADGASAGSYNDLRIQVFLQKFDAAAGDITITANRSMYVDFTIPYAEGGVFMIVPIRYDDYIKWTFLKPLKRVLWLTSIAFFLLTGAAVWKLEHRIGPAFRGPPSQNFGVLFYFRGRFSTFVFAHREQIVSNLVRLVVVVWVFVVLILNSTYTASLSSRLTAQRLKPAINDVQQLLRNKDNVGYETGSFVANLLRGLGFDESNLKPYISDEECADALTKGSQNGGISAFFSAGTHTNVFSKYSDKYMVVGLGPIYRTDGFAFVLLKGLPLFGDVSRAVINVTLGSQILQPEKMWFSNESKCKNPERSTSSSDGVNLGSFLGLFAIAGGVTGICLIVYFIHFLCKTKEELQRIRSSNPTTWPGVCGCQNNHQQCCRHLRGVGLVSMQTNQSSISPKNFL